MEATPLEHDVQPAVAAKCTGDGTVEPLDGEVTLTPANREDTRARDTQLTGHTYTCNTSPFFVYLRLTGDRSARLSLCVSGNARQHREKWLGRGCFTPGKFRRLESSKCRHGIAWN